MAQTLIENMEVLENHADSILTSRTVEDIKESLLQQSLKQLNQNYESAGDADVKDVKKVVHFFLHEETNSSFGNTINKCCLIQHSNKMHGRQKPVQKPRNLWEKGAGIRRLRF